MVPKFQLVTKDDGPFCCPGPSAVEVPVWESQAGSVLSVLTFILYLFFSSLRVFYCIWWSEVFIEKQSFIFHSDLWLRQSHPLPVCTHFYARFSGCGSKQWWQWQNQTIATLSLPHFTHCILFQSSFTHRIGNYIYKIFLYRCIY